MTLEISQPGQRRRVTPRFATAESPMHLPTRRPVDPPVAASSVRWELIDMNRYRAFTATGTKGFIDVVGAVFVALAGARYDQAVEVSQTLVFADALAALTK